MTPNAYYNLDRYDDNNPPGFEGMPELLFHQTEVTVNNLARSVVPAQNKYTWRFAVKGVAGQTAELNWNADLGSGGEQLILLDEQSMQLIDMREHQKYAFTLVEGHSFKIFFGNDVEVSPDEIVLSKPYPNPAVDKKSNFSIGLPISNNLYQTNLQMFNSAGEQIGFVTENLSAGMHQLQWQASDAVTPGLYLYRVTVSDGNKNFVSTGKIIVP
jgi:hypothetical protein